MTISLIVPPAYKSVLRTLQIEQAIKEIKDFFEDNLAKALDLKRVTAPLFVRSGTGLNDDLNGIERPVRFRVRSDGETQVEIVQSLAKWKRVALSRYCFEPGTGLYTDMNAIRPDETLDNVHSVYVDQWDWEKVIKAEERNVETLRSAVRSIYDVICRTEFHIASRYSEIRPVLPPSIHFVTSDELSLAYPDLTPKQREDTICKKHGAVFIIGIGAPLADGNPHDGRAPDYDDWSTKRPDGGLGLNGDILLWNPVLERAFEISSMGIRVDKHTLLQQLSLSGAEERAELDFHKRLLSGEFPQTMGGGIGQSRLCMFCLRAAHIGEVACGIWPAAMEEKCSNANIFLL